MHTGAQWPQDEQPGGLGARFLEPGNYYQHQTIKNPCNLPTASLSPLHDKHVVGEGCAKLETLQSRLCLPFLHLMHIYVDLGVTAGL